LAAARQGAGIDPEAFITNGFGETRVFALGM
jgi:hypothetical protein